MKYNELTQIKPKANTHRKGRGISAGQGKTAGRGTKGQGSRKSGGVRPGFEGGQMPLYMRLPKLRGFKSHRTPPSVIYTDQLENLKKTVIDNRALHEAGLIDNPYQAVKLLAKGTISTKKEVKLQFASQSAIKIVSSAGGSFSAVEQVGRPVQKNQPPA